MAFILGVFIHSSIILLILNYYGTQRLAINFGGQFTHFIIKLHRNKINEFQFQIPHSARLNL